MTPVRVLVSGGGIAGPALAYWLRRHGMRPTVVERAPAVRDGGHRLQIEGPGVGALCRMGLLDELRGLGVPSPEGIRLDYGGGRGAVIPGVSTLVSGEPGLVLRRGDLCTALHRHVRDDAEYLFDDSVTALHESDDGVTVSFLNREPRVFDLVVGADGTHSHLRSLVFGPEDRFRRYLGTNLVLFDVDRHRTPSDHVVGHVRSGRGLLLAPLPDPAREECTVLTRDRAPVTDPETHRRSLRERFAGDGAATDRALAAMDEAPAVHVAPSAQIRMDTWTRGRVALLGDAGYCPDPMTGQGSTLALVGACASSAARSSGRAATTGSPSPPTSGRCARSSTPTWPWAARTPGWSHRTPARPG
ncbi:FAD-dependent monooxygenase [Nocardiopsis sp. NPDC058789]|uniref:FAD-dependent monooxygenase n=1 Tax=Nocardiopsis sp. NPDC058789 TaxID=3346634 RepID=UPI003671A7A7